MCGWEGQGEDVSRVRGNGRALLVVNVEVGGWWLDETKSFLWCLVSMNSAAVTGGFLAVLGLHGTDVGLACSFVLQSTHSSERVTRSW